MSFFTLRLVEDGVEMLDQRALPGEEKYVLLRSGEEVARAIEDMVVRGAPAIGVAAAMGVAVELARCGDSELEVALERTIDRLGHTRPTAVNLSWALERVGAQLRRLIDEGVSADRLRREARELAQRIHDEDVATCRAIGDNGAELLGESCRVLTHCNAGALATAGYGTALGVIRSAARDGRIVRVLASETRPYLQGARLTAWELAYDAIPVTLITDSMSGALMSRGEIDRVIVGADRIALNGDVANKIGTYSLAVLARAHGIPFYVAAPLSTVDPEAVTGADIPIEQRASDEVVVIAGRRIAPKGVEALYPAFDVTPAEYISAIITERGIARPPFARLGELAKT
ncbi:MAG: S-methyl-5-thioribose-1-phosphate isomerase [Myxococcota bacterium]